MITAELVKDLRDKTGAGMADCKKALTEANGDMEAAIEYLRKRGAASAAKRADRSSNEGLVVALSNADGSVAAIVEVNCETDFVARNDEFVAFAHALSHGVLNAAGDEAGLLNTEVQGKKLGDTYNEMLAKFQERILITRFERIQTNGYVVAYTHAGNKLAVLLEITAHPQAAEPMVRDIAMQVAAMNPTFVNRTHVDQKTLDKEKEIYMQQAIEQGKKPEIAEKVAQGRVEKFYQEFCLVEQTFVKDSGKTITDVLKDVSKAAGVSVEVVQFRRYFLGEKSAEVANN